jgi:hypothetical protein
MRPGWARQHARYLRLDATTRAALDSLAVAIDRMPAGRDRDDCIEYMETLLYGEDA